MPNLVASFTLSEGAVATVDGIQQETGITVNNFSLPVIYLITAENSVDTQEWTIYVSIAPNDQTEITEYSFPQQTSPATIDPDAHTINIEVANGSNITNLVASFTLSEGAVATVDGIQQETGITVNDFSLPVIYLITAENTFDTQEWIVTVSIAVSIDDISEPNIKIYPNPATNGLYIESTDEISSISIISTIGNINYEYNAIENLNRIDISEYSPGLYFVLIKSKNSSIIKKISIVN